METDDLDAGCARSRASGAALGAGAMVGDPDGNGFVFVRPESGG